MQEILTLYAIHPCYTIQLLKSDLFTYDEQKMFIKQLFTNSKKSATSRNNYFLISIFEAMLKHDLQEKILGKEAEEKQLSLFDKDCKMISVYIFRRVIKSQQTNLDTLCCFCCHILNNILVLSSVGSSGEDNTLDVLNETVKDDGNDKKGSTGGSPAQKSQAIVDIVKRVFEELLNNQILKETGQQFGLKKKYQAQLEYIKKQFKDTEDQRRQPGDAENPQATKDPAKLYLAGIDNEEIKDKFPSMRFSEELLVMIGILNKELQDLEYMGEETKEEEICTQILGLIFIPKMLKVQSNFALFLYPYASKVKQVYQIDEQLKGLHAVNVKNIFMCIISYIKGDLVFQDSSAKSSSWCQKMNQKLTQHQHINKPLLLKKMLKFGNEISQLISYKNFENMVSHSLEQDETKISISKKLLGTFLEKLQKNIDRLVIQSPSKNDHIFKIVQELGKESAAKLKAAPDYDERVNFKLKTRIMVKHDPASKVDTFVRCRICNATLTQDIAIQNFDESIVLPQYEPQDMLSLVTAFCDVLRKVSNMNLGILTEALKKERIKKGGHTKGELEDIEEHLPGGMNEFVKQTETIARREQNYEISDMIQLFKQNLNIVAENNLRQMEKDRKKESKNKNTDDNDFDGADGTPVKEVKISDEEKIKMGMESKDRVFKMLLQEAQDKIHQRITQKFNLQLINTQIERYLMPMMNAKMAAFKEILMDQNQLKSDNYQWGLANRDLLHLTETQSQGLSQMTKVAEFTQGQKKSQALDKMLPKDQKQKIRGYLQIEAKKLLANKTIRKSRLVELNPLLEQSTVVLIEADNGQSIEFKLIFKQKKSSLCGPDRVLQEQIILKFDIPTKKLKEMRQKKGFQKSDDPKDEDQEEFLVFEENDALEFDPQGFIRLISQMERQKMAYTILQEGMDGTVSSMKKDKKKK